MAFKILAMLFLFVAFAAPTAVAMRVDQEVQLPPRWEQKSEIEQYKEAARFAKESYEVHDNYPHAFFQTTRYGECVVTFRGTQEDDFHDIQYDLNALSENMCGESVHRGFAHKLNKVLKDKAKEFSDLERNCLTLIVVGHSLGGAMASLYAACAEQKGLKTADFLYTFGAPAISHTPLSNKGRCFRGARFYNFDGDAKYDIVPNIAMVSPASYLHPMMDAIALKWMGTEVHGPLSGFRAFGEWATGTVGSEFRKVVYKCGKDATRKPGINLSHFNPRHLGAAALARVHGLFGGDPTDVVRLHLMKTYIDRLKHLKD